MAVRNHPRGGNNGVVSVVILGSGFQSGAAAKLVRSGQPDILGTQVQVAASGESLATTLDLTARALGDWDVVVVNPGSQATTLPCGFTMTSS